MVILGFSGFGLAALPLGLLADAVTVDIVLIAMGVVVIGCAGLFTLFHRRNAPGREMATNASSSASASASCEA
jgi:hypothetical protein